MHGIAQASLWVVLAVGILTLAAGAVTLGSRQVALRWLRGRLQWKRWGWAEILLGLFLELEAAPRLAGVSAGWVLVLSVAAFLPLAGSLTLQRRARLSHA